MPRDPIDRLRLEMEELFNDVWQVPRFTADRAASGRRSTATAPSGPPPFTSSSSSPGVDPAKIQVFADERHARSSPASAAGRAAPDASTSRWRSTTARSRGSCSGTTSTSSGEGDLQARRADGRAAAGREAGERRAHESPDRDQEQAMSELSSTTRRRRGRRAPGDAPGPPAEGDGRLPRLDAAARDRAGALDRADGRRRRGRPAARARHVKDADVETPGWDDLYEVGTAAVVHKMIRVPDGTLRILVQGIRRIRLDRPAPGRAIPRRRVHPWFPTSSRRRTSSRRSRGTCRRSSAGSIGLVPYLPEELAARRGQRRRPERALATSWPRRCA